jgi:hypothetical protein
MRLIKPVWKLTKNYNHERVSFTASLLVETGSCQVLLIGQDGNLDQVECFCGQPG